MIIDRLIEEVREISNKYFPVLEIGKNENIIFFESRGKVNKLYMNCSLHRESDKYLFHYTTTKQLDILAQYYEKYYSFQHAGFGYSQKPRATFRLAHYPRNFVFFEGMDRNFKAYKFEFKDNISDIKNLISLLKEDLEDYIFPTFEKMYNVHTLNKAINDPIDFHVKQNIQSFMCGNHHYDKTIVARLAGDPNFEEICQFIFSYFENIIAGPSQIRSKECLKYLTVAYDIYDQLKSVEPLKDPNLNNYEIDYDMEPVYFDDEGRFCS